MRKGIRPFVLAASLCAFFAGALALAAGQQDDFFTNIFGPGMGGMGKVSPMSCAGDGASPSCEACMQAVEKWKKKYGEMGTPGGGSALDEFSKNLFGGISPGGAQNGLAGSAKDVNLKGADKQKERADQARKAEGELKKCQEEIGSKCRKLSAKNQIAPAEVHKICQDASKRAGDFAKGKEQNADAQKKAAGGAEDLMKALGPLMQAAQGMAGKGDEGDPAQYPEYPSEQYPQAAESSTPDIGGSSLESGSSKSGDSGMTNGVGFTLGTAKTPDKTVAAGSGLTGFSSASSSGDDFSPGSNPFGGALEMGQASTSGGGGGSAGGGGGGGSSGASKEPEGVAAEVARGLGLEIGGGGVRSFSGGGSKGSPGGGEEPSLAAGEPYPQEELPAEDGERDLASMEHEENLNDSDESVFMRVKGRYALLREAGRI